MNFETKLQNRSFATSLATATTDRHGREVLLVCSKLAFRFGQSDALKLAARPVRARAESDGGDAPVFPDDFAIEKPGFDFGLVGTAEAFADGATTRDAFLSVAGRKKSIRLFGPRVYTRGLLSVAPSRPGPLGNVPLRFDRCFGGTELDANGRVVVAHPANPIGRGFARDPATLIGKACPEIELIDPSDANANAQAAFGPISHNWSPRIDHAGTYDEAWARTRAPVRPTDFDPAFERWAPPDQRLDRSPQGPIDVSFGGLRRDEQRTPRKLTIPPFEIEHTVTMRGVESRETRRADGLVVDLDASVIELSFRSAHPLPLKWEQVDAILVMGSQLPREMLTKDDAALAAEGRTGEHIR